LRDRLPYKWVVAAVFVAGLFIDIMDTTIVNVALKTMADDLGSDLADVEWIVLGYLVSLAVWIPASGWIGDRFGTKRIFLLALFLFTVASALCGLATVKTNSASRKTRFVPNRSPIHPDAGIHTASETR